MFILYIQESPVTYYTYVIFAVYFCWDNFLDYKIFMESYKLALLSQNSFVLVGYIIGYILALELFVSNIPSQRKRLF